MSIVDIVVIASFTAPEKIGTNPTSMLWLLPLAAFIAIIYKTTTLPTIKAGNFIKEVVVSFCTGIILLTITAVSLCVLAWLITE